MKALFAKLSWNVVLALAVVGLLIAGFGFWKQQQITRTVRSQIQYTALEARVVSTNDVFRIINLDSRTWLNCQFVLNRSGSNPGYLFFRDRVLPSEVVQIAHELFTDPAGNPYQFKKDPPTSLYIRCEDVDSSVGLFSGQYTK